MVIMVMKERKKDGIFARKTLGAIQLKLGMHIQLHNEGNIGWVPTDHTYFITCVRLKMPKMVYQQKRLKL